MVYFYHIHLLHIYSNTTLVKVKCKIDELYKRAEYHSNTTLVKVKCVFVFDDDTASDYSNTTLVKVKFPRSAIWFICF